MEYKTQMEAARLGIVTDEMKNVAKNENINVDIIRERIKEGKLVIPANKKIIKEKLIKVLDTV